MPNIKAAERLPLRELALALGRLTATAREGKTALEDLTGGTITITNVGVFGVDTGTPILNPGEAAILAFGAIKQQPWVVTGKNGKASSGGGFDRYGFRVPMLLVSPYAKRGYVSHTIYDHTSLTRFIEARFRVPALTSRDANAQIPIDMFDFGQPPNLTIPDLPAATVDQAALADCKASFPPK